MTSEEKSNEWDSLWQEYSKSLENWKTMFEQIQNANNEMQSKFNDVWEKATKESSVDTMKQFSENWQKALGENWQKAINDAGMKSFKEFGESWQKSLNETNTAAFKQFMENWQNSLNSSGMEQMKAYGELMKKFAETWTTMWPKSK